MDFKKKLKQRFYIGIGYMLIGLILILAGIITDTENNFLPSYGIALVAIGSLRIHQYFRTVKNEKAVRQQELEETDERNRMIMERAKGWAFSLYIIFCGLAAIILSLLGLHERALPFTWSICILTFLYWGCNYHLRKKY